MSLMQTVGDGQRVQVLSNASANSSAFNWKGGKGTFEATATWGGGSVKLQKLGPDGSTYYDVGSYTSLTANGAGNFELPPCTLKVAVTTATAVYAAVSSML